MCSVNTNKKRGQYNEQEDNNWNNCRNSGNSYKSNVEVNAEARANFDKARQSLDTSQIDAELERQGWKKVT